ncbi:glutathione S-transferase-like [Argopecten irradians]|uniref:glutathione S-transferase-like n=1 Tax=Argopecten irradians TaxID=31199 RepID=UPI0037183E57
MPTYTVYYFDARARGETIRMVLAAAGQEFTDKVVEYEKEWPALLPKMPLGLLPVLEMDGKMMPQSRAITRYLAKEFGFAGEGHLDQYWVDTVVDTAADAFDEFYEYYKMKESETDAEKKEEHKKAFIGGGLQKFLKMFQTLIENSEGQNGYFVGSNLTIADMACHDILTTFLMIDPDALKDFPKLVLNRQKVEENANLKQYLATRKERDL